MPHYFYSKLTVNTGRLLLFLDIFSSALSLRRFITYKNYLLFHYDIDDIITYIFTS